MPPERFAKATESLLQLVDGPTLRVLLMLATHADFNTGTAAFPSVQSIATKLSARGVYCGVTAVKRALRIGIERGLLQRTRRVTSNGQTSSSYDCLWLNAEWNPASLQTVQPVACIPTSRQPVNSPRSETLDREPLKHSYISTSQSEVQQLIEAFNRTCPNAKRYKLGKNVPPQIHRALQARTVADWTTIFRAVHASDYLTPPGDDPNVLRANLLWILRPDNAALIEAGQYDNREE